MVHDTNRDQSNVFVIKGEDLNGAYAGIDLNQFEENGAIVIGNGNIPIFAENLLQYTRDIKNAKNPTFIFLCHGAVENGEHQILNTTTREVFEIISKIREHKPVKVILETCYAGSATKNVEVLPEGSILLANGPKKSSNYDGAFNNYYYTLDSDGVTIESFADPDAIKALITQGASLGIKLDQKKVEEYQRTRKDQKTYETFSLEIPVNILFEAKAEKIEEYCKIRTELIRDRLYELQKDGLLPNSISVPSEDFIIDLGTQQAQEELREDAIYYLVLRSDPNLADYSKENELEKDFFDSKTYRLITYGILSLKQLKELEKSDQDKLQYIKKNVHEIANYSLSYDQLIKCSQEKLELVLYNKSIFDLLKHHKVTFDQCIALPIDKLKAIQYNDSNISTLIAQHQLTFQEILECDISKLRSMRNKDLNEIMKSSEYQDLISNRILDDLQAKELFTVSPNKFYKLIDNPDTVLDLGLNYDQIKNCSANKFELLYSKMPITESIISGKSTFEEWISLSDEQLKAMNYNAKLATCITQDLISVAELKECSPQEIEYLTSKKILIKIKDDSSFKKEKKLYQQLNDIKQSLHNVQIGYTDSPVQPSTGKKKQNTTKL